MKDLRTAPRSDDELEELLSRPPASLVSLLSTLSGDFLILGAGGKMGPSLGRMVKRAASGRRVTAVSRWTDEQAALMLRAAGVETISADLLDPRALAALPDTENVIYMAGQKFGTTGNPAMTWLLNAGLPTLVAERFRGARIAVFSTGNVYALTLAAQGGSREEDLLAPVGEYAWSCVARERIYSAAAAGHDTPTAIVRLNYAHDLRYGVLTDLGVKIQSHQPIDLRMSWVNVIWQGDANAFAIAALSRAAAPEPFVVNVAGRECLRVKALAEELAARLDCTPSFVGDEVPDALLSNSTRMGSMLDLEPLHHSTLLDWVAEWLTSRGRLLGKPTGFEKRDGSF